jgi:hypothetical protein
VSPLKCYEYLSSGLAVLSTPVPAVETVAASNPHVVTAAAGDLAARLVSLLPSPHDDVIDSRVASAREHGWDERGRVLRDLLAQELSGRRSRTA